MTEHPSIPAGSVTAQLISVGNVIVDVTVSVPRLPERGGDVVGQSHGSVPGGSFNTMLAARRQGLPTSYAGAHGTGPYGDHVRSALADAGITALHLPTDGVDTGFDIAMTEPDGERSFVTVFGAEATLTAQALDAVAPSAEDFVHVSGYGLLEDTNGAVIAGWLDSLEAEPVVLLDPGPLIRDIPNDVWMRALARSDWLSCNAREAELLTGEVDAAAAVRALRMLAPGVLVRLGADGCLVAHGDTVTALPGLDVTALGLSVRDLTGAGDAHVGAFLAALARGESPERAALTANACAALAVTRRGPATAPTIAETARVLARTEAQLAGMEALLAKTEALRAGSAVLDAPLD